MPGFGGVEYIPDEPDAHLPVRAVRRWEAALAACVCVAVFVVPLYISNDTPYASDGKRLVSGACALAAGVCLAGWWAAGGRLGRRTAGVARMLALFLCVAALSGALNRYPAAAVREGWWLAAHSILFLAAAVAFRRRIPATALLVAFLTSAALVAVYGYYQAFGVDLMGRTWWKDWGQIPLGRGARVISSVALETELGGYMATGVVLAAGLALYLARGVEGLPALTRRLLGALLLTLAGLFACCMVFSGSRAALLGTAAGLGLLLLCLTLRSSERSSLRALVAGASVCLGLIILMICIGANVYTRLDKAPQHLGTRVAIWRAAVNMWAASPVVGLGPGAFAVRFPEFRPADYGDFKVGPVTTQAHSEYLEVLAETGMLGLVPFALFIGLILVWSVRRLNEDGVNGGFLLAALAAAVTILVHVGLGVDSRFPTGQLILWVMLGLAVARWEEIGVSVPRSMTWRWIPVCLAAVAAVLVFRAEVYRPYLGRVELRNADDSSEIRDWERSVRHAERAIEYDPISAPSWYRMGKSLLLAGRYEQSLDVFGALQTVSPDYDDVDRWIAVAQARLGRIAQARETLAVALGFDVLWGRLREFESMTDEELAAAAKREEEKERLKPS